MSGEAPRVIVVGAGLAGSLIALYLARSGSVVDVYERLEDPLRESSALADARSINLAISTRGLHALDAVGLAEQVLAITMPMKGRMIHAAGRPAKFAPYGTSATHVLHSVGRPRLHRLLFHALDRQPGVTVWFGQACRAIAPASGTVELEDGAGRRSAVEADVVVAADGGSSVVRRELERLGRVAFQRTEAGHGFKELTIQAGPNGEFLLNPKALHIWPRGASMMVALPNHDGSFTSTLFWPLEGPDSFATLETPTELARYFARTYPDVAPLMPTLVEDFFAHPVGSLYTIRCRPWHDGGRVVLIGDAAHAVLPFYGQGANAAFEDCLILDQCLRQTRLDWKTAFARFEDERRENLDALADLSLENFLEMRQRVTSRRFAARKRLEQRLNRFSPRWFVPLYTTVTFTRMPYAAARRRARRQSWVVAAAVTVLALFLAGFVVLLTRSARRTAYRSSS